MSLVDSHCHLDGEEFAADRDAVVDRALAAGVDQMLAIGTGEGPPDLEAGIRMADRYDAVVASAGVHPHHAGLASPEIFRRLEELIEHPKVVAVGEIGLDYHYDFAPRERQREVFVEQLELAAQGRKPVIIHTREAWDETFEVLEKHWAPCGLPGIMHCFSGGPAEAERSLALGFSLAFGGMITFPKARSVQDAARTVPLDRLLVETDAPYLAPVPYRGKRNEPAFVVHTARALAELRGMPEEELRAATTENFRRLCC